MVSMMFSPLLVLLYNSSSVDSAGLSYYTIILHYHTVVCRTVVCCIREIHMAHNSIIVCTINVVSVHDLSALHPESCRPHFSALCLRLLLPVKCFCLLVLVLRNFVVGIRVSGCFAHPVSDRNAFRRRLSQKWPQWRDASLFVVVFLIILPHANFGRPLWSTGDPLGRQASVGPSGQPGRRDERAGYS